MGILRFLATFDPRQTHLRFWLPVLESYNLSAWKAIENSAKKWFIFAMKWDSTQGRSGSCFDVCRIFDTILIA
jgi:hypothetical protein